ncbi:MAG: acetolactate decarboxylase [Gammaproteobacteria bacterium]
MSKYFLSTLCSMLLVTLAHAGGTIYQAGTLIGLMNSHYDGTTTLADLAEKGDFGIGTINGLDGEMVVLDGDFYLSYKKDGSVKIIDGSNETPFTMVVDFNPDQEVVLKDIADLGQLEKALDQHLASENLFYAIKVTGKFTELMSRSQANPDRPYQLGGDHEGEVVNTYSDIEGTLVIFKSPAFASPMTAPGYHLHFISEDRKKVGHVFDVKFDEASADIQQINDFSLLLPENEAFLQANLIVN